MRQIEWATWANEHAFISGLGMLLGGIIGVAGKFVNWGFAAFVIPASVVLLLFEYPRSKRRKGQTIQRRYQNYLHPLLEKLAPVSTNYYARFIFHIALSVPCCFLLPTLMGGMTLMIAAIIYLIAGIKGESWSAPELETKYKEVKGISEPPDRPPPRAPPNKRQYRNNSPPNEV